MKNKKYNLDKFHSLLRKAIGTESGMSFAERAGMSRSNLSMMMGNSYDRKPNIQTLKRIADASNGKVTAEELEESITEYNSIGEDGLGDTFRNTREFAKDAIWEQAQELVDTSVRMTGSNYKSLEDYLDFVTMLFETDETMNFSYSICEDDEHNTEHEFNYNARHRAEYYSCVEFKWIYKGIHYVRVYANVYFSHTTKGNCMIHEIAFDLPSLVNKNSTHPCVWNFIMKMSARGDMNYSDYPITMDVTMSEGKAARRLLEAIFGEDIEEDKVDGDIEEGKVDE